MELHGEHAAGLLDHFNAGSGDQWVVLKWRRRKGVEGVVRVAVLRSELGFAQKAEEVIEPDSTQYLVYEGADAYCQDQDVIGDVDYYYTCFARREDGFWERQHDYHIKPKVAHVWERTEIVDGDSSDFVKAMDRMRAGFWLLGGQPTA
jgi:hypothetical protein